jgi:hypothetical protein
MSHEHIKISFETDPTLFQLFLLSDDWLEEWILTSASDIEDIFGKETDSLNQHVVESEEIKYKYGYEIDFPEEIKTYYRIAKWPATPDFLPPPECLGFHL